jgi:hypothetical protein
MASPPTLAALLADPAQIAELCAETTLGVLVEIAAEQTRLAALQAAVAARLARHVGNGVKDDRCIDLDEAAAILCVTKDWLRRRPHLPFVAKLSDGTVRCSVNSIQAFIADRCRK